MSVWTYSPRTTPTSLLARRVDKYIVQPFFGAPDMNDRRWSRHLDPNSNESLEIQPCRYCKHARMRLLHTRENRPDNIDFTFVFLCDCCGWWYRADLIDPKHLPIEQYVAPKYDIEEYGLGGVGATGEVVVCATESSLKRLDLSQYPQQIEEIRQFLLARPASRFRIHPRVFEETVASVFKDVGFESSVTSYSNDGGIDIFLSNDKGITIGVQVKRYKNLIDVSQIRELLGALVLADVTKGIFVTSSGFQQGVPLLLPKIEARGLSLSLLDGEQLLEMLRINKRESYTSLSDFEHEVRPGLGQPLGNISFALYGA